MYGTVARFTGKPSSEEALRALTAMEGDQPAGMVFYHVYKLDAGGDQYVMVVGFEDKDSYFTNANSPESNQFYEKFRALLISDPEWLDGEIVESSLK